MVDGDPVFVTEHLLDQSINVALVRDGLAYAELYATMPLDLILHLRGQVGQARDNKVGMWPSEDVTITDRIVLHDLAQLATLTMFPKLYRRLVRYFKDPRHTDLAAFDTWIRDDPVSRDDTLLLPSGEFGNLHDLYDVNADGITLCATSPKTSPSRPTLPWVEAGARLSNRREAMPGGGAFEPKFDIHIGDRTKINDVRREYFGSAFPASTLVEVSALAVPGMLVEIEAIVGIPAS